MRTFFTLALLLIATSIHSQNFKFGKVSKQELESQASEINPNADAEILYKSERIYYRFDKQEGFTQVREVQMRVKIYNKEGLDRANYSVRLYNESTTKRTKLFGIKGYTYNLNNGKVEKTKLKNEGIFDEEVNEYWKKASFALPNVKEGSVVELKYEMESPFIGVIDDIYLQDLVPIKKLDIRVRIPEFFNFKKTINPKAAFYPNFVDSTVDRKETITNANRSDGYVTQTSFSSSDFEFKENITDINLENIPPLKQENFVDNLNNYIAKMVWEYTFYKSPRGQITDYSSNWDKIAKTIYRSEGFGGELAKASYYESELDAALSGISDPMQRAATVFLFVKSKVKWNGYIGKFVNDGVKKAYKEGSGNVAEINLMLTSMLRHAGLNANPVLVSTKANGIPITATLDGFNYVVSVIEIPNGTILLDATDPYCIPNLLPERAMNWRGRLIRKNGSSTWISLQQSSPSVETKSINYKINPDLSVEGKIRDHCTLHYAQNMRKRELKLTTEEKIEKLEDRDIELVVENLEVQNEKEVTKPYVKKFDFSSEELIEEIGDKLYVSPLLFYTIEETPFKEETRDYPIDFVHPFSQNYMVNIMLPEGYEVESLPESVSYKLSEDNISDYKYTIMQNGNYIQLRIGFNFNYSFVPANDYTAFRQYFNAYIEKISEKIVLKRI
ncbi:DUF3857 domain-containing protein [Winogradskyella sp. 3972H.M.0a.05]|uniref:DUF3857 domain-containing protein n=1 Tax=Winogradskyella sp. 3972H.M.0a.05 TaxID=2950277 RepID=UPI0033949F1B